MNKSYFRLESFIKTVFNPLQCLAKHLTVMWNTGQLFILRDCPLDYRTVMTDVA